MTSPVPQHREPTLVERNQERSIIYTLLADTAIMSTLVVVALTSGSLTILGEAVRTVLTVVTGYFSVWVLFARHRNWLHRLEFSMEKLERFVWLVLGVGLCLSGAGLIATLLSNLTGASSLPSSLDFVWGAIVNAVNTLINLVGWIAMFFASGKNSSDSFQAQFYARTTMLVSSLVVQVMLTAAALTHDATFAYWLDVTGSVFVTGLILYNGFSMLKQAMPDLLDASVPSNLARQIKKTVRDHVPDDQVVKLETRRAGQLVFLQVMVTPDAFRSPDNVQRYTRDIATGLKQIGALVDVKLVLANS